MLHMSTCTYWCLFGNCDLRQVFGLLCLQDGGFYSAEDADSFPTTDSKDKKEGAFCVWTQQEIRPLLTEVIKKKNNVTSADVFCYHYGVKEDGNVLPKQVLTVEHYV